MNAERLKADALEKENAKTASASGKNSSTDDRSQHKASHGHKRSTSSDLKSTQIGGTQLSIENEKMKTELMVANQKLNALRDVQENCNDLKKRNKEANEEIFKLKDECSALKSKIQALSSQNQDSNGDIDKLKAQIEQQAAKLKEKDQEIGSVK